MGSISRPPFLRPLPSVPCFDISKETTAFATTRIDWRETPGAHIFTADLPGLRKGEVKVEMEEGKVLQINGEGSKEKEENNDTWHRVKRSSGQFLRGFRLLEKANIGQVKASMENRVLTATVPKVIEKEPDVKAIAVCG